MLWLVLTVIIVGYFIVEAIQKNSRTNALIAKRQIENNPVYQERYMQSMKYLDMNDKHLDIRERATEIDERLATPGLSRKEIAYLEKESSKIYREMQDNTSKYHKENENRPYYNEIFTENEYILHRWNEQRRLDDQLSERSRLARRKRERNYPKTNL